MTVYLLPFVCAQCGAAGTRRAGDVNRARKINAPLYCNQTCAGLARRAPPKTRAQKVEEKRLYDIEYRNRNRARLKATKHDYYKRTRDPEKEKIIRKARMPLHVEYCRKPEYKTWKQGYDRKYRAAEYGDFAEAYLLLTSIDQEVIQRSTRYEVYQQKGTAGKTQRRKRAARRGSVALG